ncbi:tRNA pseudouridine synthase A-like [Gigantopelta aegis]|uniref:tRNA pseudouridine synthase A-like n=1 Tax=Gigantopelta aegis TaxID=1735272 RepID=UPI001B88E3AF|nr:tRNA pseudouridine synthase A-like [Gigantopelta aegis]
MLRQIIVQITRFVKKMESVAEALPTALKHPLVDDEEEPAKKKAKVEVAAPMVGRPDRKRKVALLLTYCGAGYYGIQRNAGFPTIEEELIQALLKAELIPQEHADTPHKMSFQRASRTDKGVSAAGNVISLKMLLNKDNVPEEINKHLPPQIRVFAYTRGTRGFDGQHHCSHRTYTYMLPTYSFAPFEKFITEAYRVDDDTIKQVGEILAMFQGTHNFHNYTSGVKPNDPSAKRYIIKFECSKPFVRDGIEFTSLTVKGQSFMLHHIRKMIGLTTAIVKGYCGKDIIEKSWKPKRLDVPKAPGVGLFLERLHFDGYNKKFGVDGLHEPMDWDNLKDEIDKFKEEYIIKHIVRSEKEEKVMFRWLATLQCHKFDLELDEDQKFWFGTRNILRNAERAKQAEKAQEKLTTAASSADSNPEKENLNTDSSETSEDKKTESRAEELSSLKDKTFNNDDVSTKTETETDRLSTSVAPEDLPSACMDSEEGVGSVDHGAVERNTQNSEHLTDESQVSSRSREQRVEAKS